MKKTIILLFFIVITAGVSAQSTEYVPLPKSLAPTKTGNTTERAVKFEVGGSFNFGLGGNTLAIKVAPHFGVLPVKFLCIGIGGTYEFMLVKDYTGLNAQHHIFGGGTFVEGYIWQRLVLHAEYEALSYPIMDADHSRILCHGVLLGPGYLQEINDHWSVYGLFLLPVYDSENIYPIVTARVGFNFKF